MACRNHVQLEIMFFYLQAIRAAPCAVLLIGSIFDLVCNWVGWKWRNNLGDPNAYNALQPARLAWYFHPWKFRCQCCISNVLTLAFLLATLWMACAQDGFGGWRMDMVRSLQWRNAYLPRVVDDGQFSSVPNYADKISYLVLIFMLSQVRVVPNVQDTIIIFIAFVIWPLAEDPAVVPRCCLPHDCRRWSSKVHDCRVSRGNRM